MRRATWIVLAAALAAACTPDFDDRTTLKDLRVLGATAEPPELLVDMPPALDEARRAAKLPTTPEELASAREKLLPALAALSAQMRPVTITPLVVDPRGGGREVEYRVVACGNAGINSTGGGNNANPGGGGPGDVRDTISRQACPADAMVLAEGRVAGRPEDGVVPIAVTFTPTQALVAATILSDVSGIWIGMPITVGITVRAGSEQVVGIKRVIIMRRLAPDQVANRNPVVSRLGHRPTKMVELVPFDPGEPPVEVAFGAHLNVIAAPADTEAYSAPALARADGAEIIETVPKETLRYAFYATAGTFSPGQIGTDLSPLLTNQKIDLEATYHAPAKLAPGESPDVNVFVVVRDERGGASSIQTRLRLR